MTAAAIRALVECRYFYTSRLSPGQPVTVVADVLRAARAFNRHNGISGALLFDGEHFAQLLEGHASAVQALARRIEADPRHTGVDVRIEEVGRLEQVFEQWVCGWCEADELRAIVAGATVPPLEQLATFEALVRRSEVV